MALSNKLVVLLLILGGCYLVVKVIETPVFKVSSISARLEIVRSRRNCQIDDNNPKKNAGISLEKCNYSLKNSNLSL